MKSPNIKVILKAVIGRLPFIIETQLAELKYTFVKKAKDKKIKIKILVKYQSEVVKELILDMTVD